MFWCLLQCLIWIALDMQVAGRVLGRCRGALHKQSARMLAAQDALSKWPDFLTQVPLLWPLGCTACNHQNSD